MPDKIRPPSPKHIRDEAEGGLQDIARAPDPGGRVEVDDAAIDASVRGELVAPLYQGGFSPVEAAALRAGHGEQNALGKPYRSTQAEKLQQAYHAAWEAYKADYAGTRSERLQEPYLKAKQAMIDAGLMTGDV